MPARLLILDLIAANDDAGLASHVAVTASPEVSALPIATGAIAANGRAVATSYRALAAALESGFASPVDGMLIGSLASYWQARALGAMFARKLPETLVLAPCGATSSAAALSSWSWRLLRRAVLPESTVVVAPASRAGELLESPPQGDEAIAKAVVEAGALACWLRDDRGGRRAVDVLAWESQVGLLDCPPPDNGARPETAPAVLAALLATGIPLREAVARAQAAGSRLGSEVNLAVR